MCIYVQTLYELRLRERGASGMMARIRMKGAQRIACFKNDLFYQFNLNSFLLVDVHTFENYKRTERVLLEFIVISRCVVPGEYLAIL